MNSWEKISRVEMIGNHPNIRHSAFALRTVSDFSSLRNSTFAFQTLPRLAPHGMAGFVLVRFFFWVKMRAARVVKSLDNPTSVSCRERRRETLGPRKSIDCAG